MKFPKSMIKKIVFLISILFVSFFFSCSNGTSTQQKEISIQTLKKDSKEKDDNSKWSNELEPNRLSRNVNQEVIIPPETEISLELLNSIPNYKNPIYPYKKDFGSLDNSLIPENVKTTINDFFANVSKNVDKEAINFFDSNYSFNYILFIKELAGQWKSNFAQDFPQLELVEKPIESKKKKTKTTVSKNNKKDKNEKKEYEELFTKWILGEPIISETFMQIPVRIFCKHGSIDVIMLISIDNSKIYQIKISKWIKNDEK